MYTISSVSQNLITPLCLMYERVLHRCVDPPPFPYQTPFLSHIVSPPPLRFSFSTHSLRYCFYSSCPHNIIIFSRVTSGGWPWMVCRELGYPGVQSAMFASDITLASTADTTIALQVSTHTRLSTDDTV